MKAMCAALERVKEREQSARDIEALCEGRGPSGAGVPERHAHIWNDRERCYRRRGVDLLRQRRSGLVGLVDLSSARAVQRSALRVRLALSGAQRIGLGGPCACGIGPLARDVSRRLAVIAASL